MGEESFSLYHIWILARKNGFFNFAWSNLLFWHSIYSQLDTCFELTAAALWHGCLFLNKKQCQRHPCARLLNSYLQRHTIDHDPFPFTKQNNKQLLTSQSIMVFKFIKYDSLAVILLLLSSMYFCNVWFFCENNPFVAIILGLFSKCLWRLWPVLLLRYAWL